MQTRYSPLQTAGMLKRGTDVKPNLLIPRVKLI